MPSFFGNSQYIIKSFLVLCLCGNVKQTVNDVRTNVLTGELEFGELLQSYPVVASFTSAPYIPNVVSSIPVICIILISVRNICIIKILR